MKIQKNYFTSSNNVDKIQYVQYTPDSEIKEVFSIVHGKSEHARRYENFAKFLCKNGFAVYIHEHVGHGGSVASKEKLGFFLDDKQAEVMVEDTKKMTDIAKSEYPSSKIILLGHSMGSFIARIYASKYSDEISALIISGTGGTNKLAGIGTTLIKTIKLFKGKNHKSKFMNKITFGKYNDKYENVKTGAEWITRDEDSVVDYIQDEYCAFNFSMDGWLALLQLNIRANSPDSFSKVRKDLPVLIISGDMDPVGDYGEGVEEVNNNYIRAGVNNCKIKLYKGARHEVLNEINKDEVYKDVLDFVGDNI